MSEFKASKLNISSFSDHLKDNQLTGNVGLYYICYQLSRRGWNVLPTSRNAKGIDIIVYNHDATCRHAIQVKTLRKINPVPFGKEPSLIADYLMICRLLGEKPPEVFITKIDDDLRIRIDKRQKNDKISHWLAPKNYEKFKDKWSIIGEGF